MVLLRASVGLSVEKGDLVGGHVEGSSAQAQTALRWMHTQTESSHQSIPDKSREYRGARQTRRHLLVLTPEVIVMVREGTS